MTEKFYQSINDYYDNIFPLNQAQVDFVKQQMPDPASKLLEVGCANGKLTDALSDYEISGIDLESSFIKTAKKRYPYIDFTALNMLDINKLNEHFDGIICFGNTLVHISENEIKTFITKCYDSLDDGGKLMIQILNYEYIIKDKVTRLPLIDNVKIMFERQYRHANPFLFNTVLTVKDTGAKIKNSVSLTPIQSKTLGTILKDSGFSDIHFYGDFNGNPVKKNSLPLIVCSTKN